MMGIKVFTTVEITLPSGIETVRHLAFISKIGGKIKQNFYSKLKSSTK